MRWSPSRQCLKWLSALQREGDIIRPYSSPALQTELAVMAVHHFILVNLRRLSLEGNFTGWDGTTRVFPCAHSFIPLMACYCGKTNTILTAIKRIEG